MMRLQILTSSTSELNPIFEFKYIIELAKCSKCQMFILLQRTNTLYGTSDDSCGIHKIPVPFPVNTDITFRIKSVDKKILESANYFYIPSEFPWVILPDYTYESYANGRIYSVYNEEKDLYELYENIDSTSIALPQIQMLTSILCNDYGYNEFNKQLESFLNIKILSAPYKFTDMELNPEVRKIYDNKISMGRSFIYLRCGNTLVSVPLMKGLFSLAKNDKLTIEIQNMECYKNIFLITFIPIKKKSQISYNGIPFSEKIYIKCINIY